MSKPLFWKNLLTGKRNETSDKTTDPPIVASASHAPSREENDDLIPEAFSTIRKRVLQNEVASDDNNLTLLNPDFARQASENAIDLVAVHGLGGHAHRTWTHANGKLWLRDFVPNDLPGARVFTFGYNSTVCFSRETGTLRTYARTLLECIRCERTRSEERARPLIFVCHSMGGLVVKQALVIAKNEDDKYPGFNASVSGVLFLGTPHQGSKLAKYYSILLQIANVFVIGTQTSRLTGPMRTQLVRGLKTCEEDLLHLAQDFRVRTSTLQIVSFIEQKSMSGLNQRIVDEKSGFVGAPTERLVPMPDCDHREMCILGDKNSRYKLLLEAIRDGFAEPRPNVKEKKRREVIDWLPRISFQKGYEDNYDYHLEGTGQWLFAAEEYKSWRAGDASDLLWIKGKNGSGKSVLASLIVSRLQEEGDPETATAFVFCTRSEEKTNGHVEFSKSILRQLTVQNKVGIDEYLEQLYDRKSELQLEGPTWQETKEAIRSTVSNFTRVFIIFDGMDECQEHDKISDFLFSLSQSTSATVKILITSRPGYPILEDIFASCPQLPIDSGSNDQDIRNFITSKLHRGKIAVRDEVALREMEEKLFSKAEGMFLYVALSIKSLQGPGTPNQVQKKLNSMPNGLDKVYELSMQRILDEADEGKRQLALRLLLWVANAKRRLSRNEVLEAIILEPGMTDLDQDDRLANDHGLTALCGDLVRLDRDGCFYLIHGSLKDYLSVLSKRTTGPLEQYRLMQDEADFIIGEICLTYLLFEEFKSVLIVDTEHIEVLFKKFPLLQYAARYWGHHVPSTAETTLEKLVVNLIESFPQRELALQSYHGKCFLKKGITNCLHLLSVFSLVRTAHTLQDIDLLWDQKDGFGLCPLEYALFAESKDMCLWILECVHARRPCVTYMEANSAPVHLAAIKGWHDVVHLLINLGFDPEKEAGQQRSTPLALATTYGSPLVVKRLLESKVNLNCREADGQTPLIEAVHQNHTEIVSLLIGAGADVNGRGRVGDTALLNAVSNGNKGLVEMFLGMKVDFTAEATIGNFKMTPFHLAAAMKSCEMIRILSSTGIPVNILTKDLRTALHYATLRNSVSVMKLLIELGARIDLSDRDGNTPLHLAARNGYLEATRFLLGIELTALQSPNNDEVIPASSTVSADGQVDLQPPLSKGSTVKASSRDKNIALNLAAENGHAEVATLLLAEGANPGPTPRSSYSALHLAGYNGHAGLVQVLLNAGADAAALGNDQTTVLHIAAERGKIEFVQELLTAVPKFDINSRNHWNETPLHCAAKNGHAEIVQLLLARQAIVSADNNQNLPLHLAAANGHEDVVGYFLDRNINASGCSGRTPLWSAAYNGHVETVKLLLRIHGIDINASDDCSHTPLMVSIYKGHTGVACLLIDKGADVDTPSKFGHTPLHAAAIIGNEKISKELLDKGCDGFALSHDDQTPFQLAVVSDNIEIINMLYEKASHGSKISDKLGYTCVHAAAENGNIEMLQKLRALGSDPLARTVSGSNAVYFAARNGHLETIVWLIDWFRVLKINFEEFENDSESSLCEAAYHGHYAVVQKLITLRADVNKPSNYAGMDPLMYAAAYRLPRTVQQLISANADPFRLNAYGLCAMDYAARHPSMFHQLIQLRPGYQPRSPALREGHLWRTIRNCVETILALPHLPTPKDEYDRNILVLTLGYSLVYINETSHEDAKLCFMELSFVWNQRLCSLDVKCSACHQKLLCKDHYVCTQCLHVVLCQSCASNYIVDGESPNSAPEGVEVLQILENELLEVRREVKEVIKFGVQPIASSYTNIVVMRQWLKDKIEAYGSWEKTYNSKGDFENYRRPGQEFVQLIEETRTAVKDLEGQLLPAHKRDNIFAPLNRKMRDLFRKHDVDVDAQNFICAGHKYLHISKDEREKINSTGDLFDTQDRLKTTWMESLLDRYQIEDDNTTLENDAKTVHGGSIMQIGRREVAINHGGSPGADSTPNDSGIKRPGKPDSAEQTSEANTSISSDPLSSVNKLSLSRHQMNVDISASTHLQGPAIMPSMENKESQDHARDESRDHRDDGGGSRNLRDKQDLIKVTIAEELLHIYRSNASLPAGQAERATIVLPVIETALRLADMIQPGSSEAILHEYQANPARQQ